MKFFTLMFFVLILNVSCKTQTNYNKEAYAEIMDSSIPLFAKEEKGKVYPSNVVRFSDTLQLNSQLKAVVDSVNIARKSDYKR